MILLGATGAVSTSENAWIVGRSSTLDFVISRNSATGLNGMVISKSGNVGFGTDTPSAKLEVNGTTFTKALTVGNRISTNSGSIDRISIIPYKHTGGPWNIYSRDTHVDAFLDFNYGINENLLTIQHQGRVGLGVAEPKERLEVNGSIRAKEVKIEATGWADFVFSENYKLPTLSEVENHIKENKHLPDIPSESEAKENGISVGEMQIKLLQKIEELTLYVIELDKKDKEKSILIDELKLQLETLQK